MEFTQSATINPDLKSLIKFWRHRLILTGDILSNNNMSKEIKSGKDVIEEFFSEIYNIDKVDEKTVDALVSLYNEEKLTDKNIQNALEALVLEELNPTKKADE